jgi:hypothetical protein
MGRLLLCLVAVPALVAIRTPQPPLDPAAWGNDHVGKPVPEFVTGDECLFCHRKDVGASWNENRHQRTVREISREPAMLDALRRNSAFGGAAREITHVLGDRRRLRFLKATGRYGELALLSAQWAPPTARSPGTWLHAEHVRWDTRQFGATCAGCHATAVDASGTFAAISLDCYVCHGVPAAGHTEDGRQVLLARPRRDPARVVASICGQCHVRTGKSRSTGRPFADNFVPGDNLFRDLAVDWSPAALAALNPADGHVVQNVRDVVVAGRNDVTCLSCHDVHSQTTERHRTVLPGDLCLHCHHATGPKTVRPAYTVHSATCGY